VQQVQPARLTGVLLPREDLHMEWKRTHVDSANDIPDVLACASLELRVSVLPLVSQPTS